MSDSTPEEKVALVTGASAGIGKAIVRRLLDDGWKVYGAAKAVSKALSRTSSTGSSRSRDIPRGGLRGGRG